LTKADLVVQRLREDIASGAIPRGDRLDQRDLAARFGMSPTPVREALVALAAEGILVHRPNQGVTVADLASQSVEEFEEIYIMREALERAATERAHQHVSRAELVELQRINDAFRQAMEAGALAEAQLLNYSFHTRIYEQGRAARLFRTIETLWTLFPWDTLWVMKVGEGEPDSVKHHERILEALRDGTAAEAGAAMVEHIQAGYEALRAGVAAERRT
jgi:DNA-binding GntR family transcriptional regulator